MLSLPLPDLFKKWLVTIGDTIIDTERARILGLSGFITKLILEAIERYFSTSDHVNHEDRTLCS